MKKFPQMKKAKVNIKNSKKMAIGCKSVKHLIKKVAATPGIHNLSDDLTKPLGWVLHDRYERRVRAWPLCCPPHNKTLVYPFSCLRQWMGRVTNCQFLPLGFALHNALSHSLAVK